MRKLPTRRIVALWIVTVMLVACACTFSIGTYDVTFVDYKGNLIKHDYFNNGIEVTKQNGPYVASRDGYEHTGWVKGKDVADTKSGAITMWPEYRLDENSGTWDESGRRIDWYGSEAQGTVYLVAGQLKSVMIRDHDANKNLSVVTLTGEGDVSPDITSFEVYDSKGVDMERNAHLIIDIGNAWQVQSYDVGTCAYVLELVVAQTGYYTVTVV